jgi:hypothetical protein
MHAMMHDDEQNIAYKRHLERININYLLEYNFLSRYSYKLTRLTNRKFAFTQEVVSNNKSITSPLITYTRNH